jgi:hypothetical protein
VVRRNRAGHHSTQNSRVVALKRSRDAELDADDKFDLTSLDKTLSATRAELNRKYKKIRLDDADKDVATTVAAETSTVSQLNVKDRR